jgi:hypothetical protein
VDYGDLGVMAPLLVLRDQLRAVMLDTDMVWILPPDVLAGVSAAYGIPVVRADVPEPMIGLPGR